MLLEKESAIFGVFCWQIRIPPRYYLINNNKVNKMMGYRYNVSRIWKRLFYK